MMYLLRLLCYFPAAEGVEAYTVGLIRATDFAKYSAAMGGATDPTDGDDIKMAGGFASIVFDQESGEPEGKVPCMCAFSLRSGRGFGGGGVKRRSHRFTRPAARECEVPGKLLR